MTGVHPPSPHPKSPKWQRTEISFDSTRRVTSWLVLYLWKIVKNIYYKLSLKAVQFSNLIERNFRSSGNDVLLADLGPKANKNFTTIWSTIIQSTKITGFWLDESSTINPKLYSTEYQLIPNCTLQTRRHEVVQNKLEFFQTYRNQQQDIRRFRKFTRGRPEVFQIVLQLIMTVSLPKISDDFQSWPKELRKYPKLNRRISKGS